MAKLRLPGRGLHEVAMSVTAETVFEQFDDALRAFVRSRVGDPNAAEDVLQEAYLRIHARIQDLREEEKIKAWVYAVVRSAIADHYRRTKTAAHRETAWSEAGPDRKAEDPVGLPGVEPEAELKERLDRALKNMLGCLPDEYRDALIATEYEGLKQRELAKRLGISVSGAKSRVQRARARLKELLLVCCEFELDRIGHVVDFRNKGSCCAESGEPGPGEGPG